MVAVGELIDRHLDDVVVVALVDLESADVSFTAGTAPLRLCGTHSVLVLPWEGSPERQAAADPPATLEGSWPTPHPLGRGLKTTRLPELTLPWVEEDGRDEELHPRHQGPSGCRCHWHRRSAAIPGVLDSRSAIRVQRLAPLSVCSLSQSGDCSLAASPALGVPVSSDVGLGRTATHPGRNIKVVDLHVEDDPLDLLPAQVNLPLGGRCRPDPGASFRRSHYPDRAVLLVLCRRTKREGRAASPSGGPLARSGSSSLTLLAQLFFPSTGARLVLGECQSCLKMAPWNPGLHRPPKVQVHLGGQEIEGVVLNVKIDYLMFLPDGSPCRPRPTSR